MASKTPAPTEKVRLTVELPRHYKVSLRKDTGAEVVRDLQDLDKRAFRHIVEYGLGRFNRDGASPDADVKDGNTTRKRTPAEMATEAVRLSDDKWKRLVENRLRERVGGPSDPVLGHLRTIAVKALVKRGVARKAIPKLPDREAIAKVMAPYGADLFAKAVARAEHIAKLEAEVIDL